MQLVHFIPVGLPFHTPLVAFWLPVVPRGRVPLAFFGVGEGEEEEEEEEEEACRVVVVGGGECEEEGAGGGGGGGGRKADAQ